MFRTITYLAAAIMLASSSGCGEASSGPKTDLMALGDSLTKATFDTLSATLQKAIATAGFHGAVELCHTEATGLTESFSDMQTNIRRTALRARNEANQPDSLEYVQLKKFQSMVDSGSVLSPLVMEDAFGNVHYFKPILLQPLCLGCHGQPGSDINDPTLFVLGQLYPQDQATGYNTGDLRGMWHVTFSKHSR